MTQPACFFRIAAVALGLGLAVTTPAVRGADDPADLVVFNARVLTVDPGFSQAAAVAIKDGVFVAVGSNADVRRRIGEFTRTIDARGRTVVPGLNETHVHSVNAARGEILEPFRQLNSIGEIQEWVREAARESKEGQWISLPRVDVTRIREGRLPTRADLDAAAPRHPAVFTWQYANRARQVLNTAALRAAGIGKATVAPPGGKIFLGPDGEPTGVMDNSRALILKFLPGREVPEEEHLDAIVDLYRRYNAIGITSVTERSANLGAFRTIEKLKRQQRLPLRVTVTIGLGSDGTVAGTEKNIRALPFKTGDGDDWLRVGPLKVRMDGGALYGTAYMREPYGPDAFALYGLSDPAYRGDLLISPDKMKNIVRTAHRMGWQMSSHVTGDAGVDVVLDALEAAIAAGAPGPGRYNLIHAYFPNPETAARAARLGAAVDTQPAWYYKDGDALRKALGEKRLAQFIGVKEWSKAGVKVALNSDHMQGADPDSSLNPYNPFLAIQTAVTRRTEGGQVFGPQNRISREEALRMVTVDAAWLSFDEKRKGSIEVGKLGDLAILSDDYLQCPDDRIKDIRAVVTVVGGKVVYESPGKR